MQKIDRAFTDGLVGQIRVATAHVLCLGARCRVEGGSLYHATEVFGLVVRLRAEMFGEHASAYLVLAPGRRIVSPRGIQSDQGAMSRFVVRLTAEPESRHLGAALPVAETLIGGGKQRQDAQILRTQFFPREKLPLIEHRAVRQGEARQEVV